MERLKRWAFLLTLAFCGIIYLSVYDHWSIYLSVRDKGTAMVEKLKKYDEGQQEQEEVPQEIINELSRYEEEAVYYWDVEDPVEEGETVESSEEIPPESQIPPSTEEEISVPPYVWGSVDESYFDDAVFIGDSRTVGLQNYGNWSDQVTFMASTGLMVHKAMRTKVTLPGSKNQVTIEEALSAKQYGKIYIMFGINELGRGDADRYLLDYSTFLDKLKELQPNAIIYIQSGLKVTAKRAAKGDMVTNTAIEERNEIIKSLADEKQVFYLNVNEAVCDEDGNLFDDYTHDGVHLKAQYLTIWKDYLCENAVIKE
ncbi:MAG: GDSL-type esterase/lipase family protein [Acetatifactor sp.]